MNPSGSFLNPPPPYEGSIFENAADELAKAYLGGSADLFMEDDPKYLKFLETKTNASKGSLHKHHRGLL
ncbi:hypothetical protein CSQ89_21670 [Chitinimonas sp. BJB300]|nr:hypothetical protein CSQ89_21670 [Chitinimonas sp. BJB300]TSJ80209.1 hypothetical protein FG002_022380 [Chitinimonas sp. BJB300]